MLKTERYIGVKMNVLLKIRRAVSLIFVLVLLFSVFILSSCGKTENKEDESSETQASAGQIVNGVVEGSGGWLYYASTLGDYTGENNSSDRKIYNAAHNISLMQKYCESKGISFVFAAAPNKNSIYYENMPDSYVRNTENGNIERFHRHLDEMNVRYVDLLSLFSDSDEKLYLKTDSHWNTAGAAKAYDALLGKIGKDHISYDSIPFSEPEIITGDLAKALSPEKPVTEENITYDTDFLYEYKNQVSSVEDALILTESSQGKGSLLMFRDSFGNSLLPFMADSFSSACFSKGVPYLLGRFISVYSPDTVIVEVAQRNLSDYAVAPPVFCAMETELPEAVTDNNGISASVNIKKSMNDMDFLQIYGKIEGDESFTGVIAEVNGICYEAFTVTDTEGDYSFLLYLNKDILSGNEADITVYAVSDGEAVKASEYTVNVREIQ